MVEITLSIVLQFFQTAGILVGIIYYLTIMRNVQRSKQREMIFQRFHFDLDFSKAWADVMYKDVSTLEQWREVYDPVANPQSFANMTFLQNRYQLLGIMLKEKVVDSEMLFQLFNPVSIMTAWEHYREQIIARRETGNQPTLFEGFEYLAEEARKRNPDITPRKARWGYELE
jgi:hypothetical protein